jgi:glutaredoxin-like protein
MALLDESIRNEVKKALGGMTRPVRLVMFTQGHGGVPECRTCADARMLAEEVASLNDNIILEIRDFTADGALAETLRIDKIPAMAVLSGDDPPRDYGIHFFGIPAGYEFSVLIEDLRFLSGGEHGLSGKTVDQLWRIREPIHLQVFTTPTCPRCPQTALLAHRLAFAGGMIRSDVVESMEFPHLVNRYGIRAVPLTVVNEVLRIEGAYPEDLFIEQVLKAEDPSIMADLKKQQDARSFGGA